LRSVALRRPEARREQARRRAEVEVRQE
jgi:hypothetical protein